MNRRSLSASSLEPRALMPHIHHMSIHPHILYAYLCACGQAVYMYMFMYCMISPSP